MSTDEKPDNQASTPPSKQTVILLLSTLADTTWRLFVPTILGVILGLWGDTQLDSKPWLTVAGTMTGAILSGLLVYKQIKQINKDSL